jgi:hypothetical protein
MWLNRKKITLCLFASQEACLIKFLHQRENGSKLKIISKNSAMIMYHYAHFMNLQRAIISIVLMYFLITVNTLVCMQDLSISRQKAPIEQIYHMLEGSGAFERDKVPEIKDKIVGYLHDQGSASIREEYYAIFRNYKKRSLKLFIPKHTEKIEAAFVDEDTLMLYNFLKHYPSEPTPIRMVKINTKTLQQQGPIIEVSDTSGYGITTPFFYIERNAKKLLFYQNYCSRLMQLIDLNCHPPVVSKLSEPFRGTDIIDLTEDRKYLIVRQNRDLIKFFDTENLCFDPSKTIVTEEFGAIAHHQKKKMFAYVESTRRIKLLYDYSSEKSQVLNFADGGAIGPLEFNHDGSLLFVFGNMGIIFNLVTLEKFEVPGFSCHLTQYITTSEESGFIDNHVIVNGYKHINFINSTLRNVKAGTHLARNKKGDFVYKEDYRDKIPTLLTTFDNNLPYEEFEKLTLKQRRFMELLYALKCTYEERLEQLKKINPAKYDDIERLNIMLKYIPERVQTFTKKDIEQTWQSYPEPTQQFLRKCFNVVE